MSTQCTSLNELSYAAAEGERQDVWDQLPCRSVQPDAFFAETPADVEWAKALCAECPVKARCLDGALERKEPWGVWGGQLFINGVVVARKRPRGRPRKNPLPEPAVAPTVAPAAAVADRIPGRERIVRRDRRAA